MNHETTIKRIQALVPDVMALEFGCEGENNLTKEKFFIVENCNPMGNKEFDITMFNNKTLYLYEGLSSDKDIKILGKPITLAITLLAIRQSQNVWLGFKLRETQLSVLEGWNLEKDNFNDQSEGTKVLIGEIINR